MNIFDPPDIGDVVLMKGFKRTYVSVDGQVTSTVTFTQQKGTVSAFMFIGSMDLKNLKDFDPMKVMKMMGWQPIPDTVPEKTAAQTTPDRSGRAMHLDSDTPEIRREGFPACREGLRHEEAGKFLMTKKRDEVTCKRCLRLMQNGMA